MITRLALIVACLLVWPAEAQAPDVSRAVRALAANWRPIAPEQLESTEAAISACAGAIEEIAAVDAALPIDITPQTLAHVRALRGLVIVSADDAIGGAYFFPAPDLAWFASGLGAVRVVSEAEGYLAVRDAAGRDIALQLGRAGGRAALRVRTPDGQILKFIGCAPTQGG